MTANQPFIGGDQRDVRIDPKPALTGEHLNVEVKMVGGAAGIILEVRDPANRLAFHDLATVENMILVKMRRVHVHVAEADVLVVGIHNQMDRLLFRGSDNHAVADCNDCKFSRQAAVGAIVFHQA